MAMVGTILLLGVAAYAAGSADLLAPSQAIAADDCQTFPQTGKTACGDFLKYWQEHGALAQQGYPISDVFDEKSETDGITHKVQYFERAVFEAHPEFQPPNNVLLSLVGSQKYKAKYLSGAPASGTPPPAPPAASTGDATGQTLNCKCTYTEDGSFAINVTEIKRTDTLGKNKASGIYVLFLARVTNTGKVPAYISSGGLVTLDTQGRKFSAAETGQSEAQQQYVRKGFVDTIQPALSADMVFVFDIAPDATGLRLGITSLG